MHRKTLIIIGVVVIVLVAAGIGLWKYHEQPQFCSLCHIMKPYVEGWKNSDYLVKAHADTGITCLKCHEPAIQQQVEELVKFIKKDYRVPLKQRRFPDDWCFRCHEHGSREELIARTQGYVVNNTQVNPHNPHPNSTEVETLPCYSCHKMHRESPGIDYCYSCHHKGTFESCYKVGCHAEG